MSAEAIARTAVVLPILTLIARAATETPQAAEASGIGAIGLDARALIFQLVNFAILLFLLRLFAYKPILKVLQKRQRTISESLRNAKVIEHAKVELEGEKIRVIQEARVQAQEIIVQSRKQAAAVVAEAEQEARRKADQIIVQGQAQLEQDVSRARSAIKQEVFGLVAQATETIIDLKLDPKKDAALIEQAIKQAGKAE